MAYRNVRDKTALVLFAIPILALLIWYFYSSHGPARLLLSCYVLVATLFFLLVPVIVLLLSQRFFMQDMIVTGLEK